MKTKQLVFLIPIVALVLLAIFTVPKFVGAPTPIEGGVACTMEAKLCPDGSYVSRSGPQCEFAQCPSVNNVPVPGQTPVSQANGPAWKTFENSTKTIEFKYPETLPATYISAQAWPPRVTTASGSLVCKTGGEEITGQGSVVKKTIGGKTYCVRTQSEGAAGSVYNTYTYTTMKIGSLVSINFTLRYTQCMNYDLPKQTQCLDEQASFDLDGLVDKIAASLKFE